MLWLILVVVILAVLIAVSKGLNIQQSATYEYEKQPVLFTPAERSFLGVLDAAIGTEYRIFGKVRVADVLKIKSTGNKSRNRSAFNKINAKHFDYVVCNKNDLSVLCVIELDDKSHNQRSRQNRDNFLESACNSAQLTLLRFEAKKSYPPQEVRGKILQGLGVATQPVAVSPANATQLPESKTQNETEPVCPKCAAPMVKRVAKSGQHAGKQFWACSTYPKCRTIKEIVTASAE